MFSANSEETSTERGKQKNLTIDGLAFAQDRVKKIEQGLPPQERLQVTTRSRSFNNAQNKMKQPVANQT